MKILIFILFPTIAFAQYQNKTDIFDAVRNGDLQSVKNQIAANPDLANSIDSNNHTLLIIAAYYGQKSIVDYILPLTNKINHKSANGTALAAAVVKNHSNIINTLLDYRADVNITDDNGVSPLMYAIMFRNIPIITLLIRYNADLHLVDQSGKTTFEYALSTENQDIINLLKN